MTVLDTLKNFELFLVGVIDICFILGPPMSKKINWKIVGTA